jgi:maltooligosyltrehalose trehalohydrolase
MNQDPNHLPQGACRQQDGSVAWRIWAPHSEKVTLILAEGRTEVAMEAKGFGYFEHREAKVDDGLRYVYRLADGGEYPDPASRWQPDGVHRPSAVFSPGNFAWSDDVWQGVPRADLVIYELHVGAFTPEGTFDAIVPRLGLLRELGITAIEIMPVAQFSGERNWGYDGVHPFAVQASYGGPQGLQRLVDAAHRERLGVILDVVYNHVGPEGNYLACFGPYFTDRYHTPWGTAVNFDGPDSDAVRQFFIDNACMWVREFHLDGLRLDAVETIFDFSPQHILADISAAVGETVRPSRPVHVIAESDQNDVRLVNAPEQGGYGLDAVWSDDFHHSVHVILTHERHRYYQDFGCLGHLASAYNEVFVHNGCYRKFRRRRHGGRAGNTDRSRFVVCVQNHDQVGNRALGDRFGTLLAPEAQRLACALLLLSPFTPLIFMGEEYGETRPFPFFCSFDDAGLIEAVRRGRRQEFAAVRLPGQTEIPDPQDAQTFWGAKLAWQWPAGTVHAGLWRLYAALLAARRNWPALRNRTDTMARIIPSGPSDGDGSADPGSADPSEGLLVLQRGGKDGLLAIANLSRQCRFVPDIDLGGRTLLLSSEEGRFGGSRTPAQSLEPVLPFELQAFGNGEWRP